MSSVQQRVAAPVVTLPMQQTLADRLRAAGIDVPDQARARHAMQAYLLGFDPSVSAFRMRVAFLRRLVRQWASFGYGSYCKSRTLQAEFGAVPSAVKDLAERIMAAEPEARLIIKAQKSDPWLIVRTQDEELAMAGWMYIDGELVLLI